MRGERDQSDHASCCLGLTAVAAVCAVVAFLLVVLAPPAQALPSYARQTGQPCGTCHTDFAGLTPYGRLFKIGGYTAGGGPYRTTLFPGSDDSGGRSYVPPLLAKSIAASTNSDQSEQKAWVPPISMMAIVGFTNTQAPLPPPTAPYNANNNVVVSPDKLLLWRRHHRSHRCFPASHLQCAAAGWVWHRSVRHAHLDLGQYRYPLCKLDEPRQFCCYLRHHRKQQSHRPGPLEYHAGLGLPLRRVDPGQRFRAHDDNRRRLCGACRQRRRLCVCQ